MKSIQITVTLTDAQAWEYAQFLKRVMLSDYAQRATGEPEAYRMMEAGEAIRSALAEQGYAPR